MSLHRRSRPGVVARLLLLIVATAACGRSGPGPEPGTRPALELVATEAQQFVSGPLPAGTYVAYGLSTGAVHQPVHIVDVQPLARSGGVEYVGSHLAYYACDTCARHPGTYGTKVLLGETCGSTDVRNRALLSAVGRDLVVGDAPHFVVTGRVTGAGAATIKGIVVTYRVGRRTFTVSSPTHGITIDPAGQTPDPRCRDQRADVWHGGSDEQSQTTLLD